MQALAGWVLAGGHSRRFGSDKALLMVDGKPLAALVAERVTLAAGSATLVGRPERLGHLGFPAIDDFEPGQGPLAGILTVLRSTQADWNLICACDLPRIDVATLTELCSDALTSTDCQAIVPRTPEGKIQPLCALYSQTALEPLERSYTQGNRTVWRALEGIRVHYHFVPGSDWAHNLNTPKDFSALHYGR